MASSQSNFIMLQMGHKGKTKNIQNPKSLFRKIGLPLPSSIWAYNNYDHHMSVIYYWTEWHTIHSICMLASVYTCAGTFEVVCWFTPLLFVFFWQMKDWKVKIPWAVLLLKWLCGRRTGGTELKEQRNRYIYFKMFALSINSAWSPLPLMTGKFLI